ncbi:2-amino-4-oxopentanoate thiolase subunit OrtA [Propionimicrobium sp. PCR01-08-3]|uniref:2-amino-4-oxopentanoate thiolase subunit OrtA n=1 Tax=Propionimicrobium sp. PCR01-08-3 TaxID=3052086 RepID=UPI00255CD924|nr:2-amino-4-oxopentanoate thiolase subunit OrtA [Propionimicrobium sp. PCR01-08-3]WIY82695.1 2-amino-4-oxopentanoate thiolase subunit OrtA [Propionimicrobium sp. PCR01-08-3]
MTTTTNDTASAGTWVEIQRTILTPQQRAAGLPADTAATPLVQWVDGFLVADAQVGDEVTIRSIIGRAHTGTLSRINPSYSHSFGTTVREILTIGTEYES